MDFLTVKNILKQKANTTKPLLSNQANNIQKIKYQKLIKFLPIKKQQAKKTKPIRMPLPKPMDFLTVKNITKQNRSTTKLLVLNQASNIQKIKYQKLIKFLPSKKLRTKKIKHTKIQLQ